jgi:hypothetical protein
MQWLREMIAKVGGEGKSPLVSGRYRRKSGGLNDDRHIVVLIEYRIRREARIE